MDMLQVITVLFAVMDWQVLTVCLLFSLYLLVQDSFVV
jgi:hypothetical protein